MKTRHLPDKPLLYLVLAELLVLAALGIAAWQLFGQRLAAHPPPAIVAQAPDPSAGAEAPPPGATPIPIPTVKAPQQQPKPSSSAATAAIGLDPAVFGAINRENTQWQAVQWDAIGTVVKAARAYLETVVVPSIEDARKRHPASGAASESAVRISSERVG